MIKGEVNWLKPPKHNIIEWTADEYQVETARLGRFVLTIEPPNGFCPYEWFWAVKPTRGNYTVSGYSKTYAGAKRSVLAMARKLQEKGL